MTTIEMARRLAELGQAEKACEGFALALRTQEDLSPADKMEAALFVLQLGGDYTLSYRALLELNRQGEYREESAAVMTEAFYEPNEKLLRSHYENNCKLLRKYPYLFRKDFLPFEELPVRFYPFDDKSFVPCRDGAFGEVTDYSEPVVTRNFFCNLDDPILAKDVYSQYELEYLNDNVRPSEWVGRENHIYLHYTDWAEFCAHLQVLNLRKLLEGKKLVFLIEEELSQYPIDFKERFGLDYSQYPVKPLGVREINRLVWQTQLSYHNGGDFFNEVLDGHPNMVCTSSIMYETLQAIFKDVAETLDDARNSREIAEVFDSNDWGNASMIQELFRMRDRTDKDIMVAYFFRDEEHTHTLDPAARITPAIMLQPHFGYFLTNMAGDSQGRAIMTSTQFDEIFNSPIFKNFKYIKTFTPMRRITTSYAAAIRFMANQPEYLPNGKVGVVHDEVLARVSFRGFMKDPQERIFKDSVVVRFEDAKLNPTATFRALTEFLDLPYTESMTYCSFNGQRMEAYSEDGTAEGFDTEAVYRTHDEFATDAERCYIEYFLRDAYEYYGYDFHYYKGESMDKERVEELIRGFSVIDHYMLTTMRLGYLKAVEYNRKEDQEAGLSPDYPETVEEEAERITKEKMEEADAKRKFVADLLMKGITLVNMNGRQLQFIPVLKLDPALMERPMYH